MLRVDEQAILTRSVLSDFGEDFWYILGTLVIKS
jgi:hypothetical protein